MLLLNGPLVVGFVRERGKCVDLHRRISSPARILLSNMHYAFLFVLLSSSNVSSCISVKKIQPTP